MINETNKPDTTDNYNGADEHVFLFSLPERKRVFC